MLIVETSIQVQMRYFAPHEGFLPDYKSASGLSLVLDGQQYRVEAISSLNSNMGEADEKQETG
jgi:hypothetical protein